MTREAKLLWMKDLLEHLNRCHEQWEGTEQRNERYLADSMRRNLDEMRRLCDSLAIVGR